MAEPECNGDSSGETVDRKQETPRAESPARFPTLATDQDPLSEVPVQTSRRHLLTSDQESQPLAGVR
jgi:hypothetical protein